MTNRIVKNIIGTDDDYEEASLAVLKKYRKKKKTWNDIDKEDNYGRC